MSKKLFVGGLAWATTSEKLLEVFSAFGAVVEAKVVIERETGRSRGFGFVTFEKDEDASAASSAMNGKTIDGRTIRIDGSDNSDSRPRRPSGERREGGREGQGERREGQGERREGGREGQGERREGRAEGARADSDRAPREREFERAPREREAAPRHHFSQDFSYPSTNPKEDGNRSGGRDARRNNRKRDKNRYDDDDRW
ncbi:MAG: RNA-binding protein [Proteobacteria bacterium]|nr:RNA-binding protein [Pseudomonadota bacterium]